MVLRLVLSLIVVALIAAFGREYAARKRRLEIAHKHGCEPIKRYPCKLPFGWDVMREAKRAMQAGRPNEFGKELFQKCGSSTYERVILTERPVFTMDPVNIQTIHSAKFDEWETDDRRGGRHFFGQGVLNTNGATWRRNRELVNPLFKRAELSNIADFEKFADRLIEQIPRDGRAFDLQPLLRKLFLDSSTEFVFGESIDSLRDTTGKADAFLAAFNRAIAGAGKRIMGNKLSTYLNAFDKQWEHDCEVVHEFIDDCIARHRSDDKTPQAGRYVLLQAMSDEIPDPVELRFQLLNLFSPARETSAMAFSNTVFLLARNPTVWTELRDQAASIRGPLTADSLRSLTLFRNTVFESLRLHCPITKARRIAAKDTILPRGGGPDDSSPILIPKGTMVYTDMYPLMRDPTTWGEDVDAFRPGRFEGRVLNWDFAPFLGGPRICPANQQVVLQSIYLLVRLVREFEAIENRDECYEFIETVRMCYECVNGCKIALHPGANIGQGKMASSGSRS